MIFKQFMVDQILAGRKTQTRRSVKPMHNIDGLPDYPCSYVEGRTYSVQPGRGKKGVARIKVASIRRERWEDISEADACAEGFGDLPKTHTWPPGFTARDRFLAYVRDLYTPRKIATEQCWVIEFELEAHP